MRRFFTDGSIHYNEERMTYINEEGLYSLIFACKLPLAKLFKKWVMKEVLPSIRKTGQYKLQEQLADAMQKLEIKNQELDNEKQEKEQEVKARQEAEQKIKQKDLELEKMPNLNCVPKLQSLKTSYAKHLISIKPPRKLSLPNTST
jgi:prophage antirepressor-like protein